MKLSLPALILPLISSIAAGCMMSVDTWEQLRPALLPAISVVAAAVLVRLARGLPFTNADHFGLTEFRDVAKKLESNARNLRALIFVCLAAIVSLIGAPLVLGVVRRVAKEQSSLQGLTDSAMSGATAFLTVYSFLRVIEVVQSDVGLLKLQSKIIESAIAKKNAKSFESQVADHPPQGIAGAEHFGRPLN